MLFSGFFGCIWGVLRMENFVFGLVKVVWPLLPFMHASGLRKSPGGHIQKCFLSLILFGATLLLVWREQVLPELPKLALSKNNLFLRQTSFIIYKMSQSSASTSSSSLSSNQDSDHRSCASCKIRMSTLKYDKHAVCAGCRNVKCDLQNRC